MASPATVLFNSQIDFYALLTSPTGPGQVPKLTPAGNLPRLTGSFAESLTGDSVDLPVTSWLAESLTGDSVDLPAGPGQVPKLTR